MGRRRRADEDEDDDVDEDVTTEEEDEDEDDVSDDARADEEEEEEDDEADEDDELEAEMAALEAIKRERGRAKSGAVGAKTFVNNAKGLDACLEDFQWTNKAKWIDHMAITGANADRVVDVNDDLTRETFFYERALESANECVKRLKDLGIPARRPDDYYAEMVKSDEHMKRVRSELLFEQQQLEIREERRKARESKKYGKQVQAEKIKQRTLEKKSQIKSLDKWRKQRQKSGFADDGNAPFEGAGGDGKRKRSDRDSKYGFGGRKKTAKRNDKFSANDMSGYKPSSFDKDIRSGKTGGLYVNKSGGRGGGRGGKGGRGRR